MTEPPNETEPPTLTSQRLISGRYRLRRVIGRGATGLVWLAYDEVLHRQIAVKEVQLPEGMPAEEASDIRERTLREARAIAALTHPNVVAVYDVARQGVEPFVVMELVRGRSLAQFSARSGPLNAEQMAVVADAIAAGLDMAHRRGITHRDVKPGNVLVGEDGQVKLTDFGISRNVSEVTMTSSGIILGTPAYMAPEVAGGGEVTTAADLWSFGATLYSCVTGQPPYDKGDPLATVHEIVDGEIPRVDDDKPLADVITGLMAKDPAERLSLVEVRRRIRPLLPEPGSAVFPADETEEDPGPVDNKPTTHLASPKPLVEKPAAPRQLAADPGPLPWAAMAPQLAPAPGPLPSPPQPVRRRRRRPVVTALLLVVAVILFCAAAGGGFAATRLLAGQRILPPSTTQAPTSAPTTAPQVRKFTTVPASASSTTDTAGSQFSISVPVGWSKFVEQRGPQGTLPASTVVRWVEPDGTAELTVEHYPDYFLTRSEDDYTNALRNSDPHYYLGQLNSVYLFRASRTLRSTYFSFVVPQASNDLWVVSVTVPTGQELSGEGDFDLFDKISVSFHLTG